MLGDKDVLTTGDVARACRVTINTVIKWFEEGRLPGYRLPGSRDRRFARPEVERFMHENGIPLDLLDGGRRRVLVVDDDEAVREMIRRYLTGLGTLDVETASSGYEGGLKTARVRPHVLLLDYRLGDTTGDKVVVAVRAMEDLRQPAILIMSAHITDEQVEEVCALGADDFLRKPFDLEQLRDLVLQHAKMAG